MCCFCRGLRLGNWGSDVSSKSRLAVHFDAITQGPLPDKIAWWSSSWWDVTGRLAIYATNCSNLYQVHLVPAVRVVSSTFK